MRFSSAVALVALAMTPTSWASRKESPREYMKRAGYLDCPTSCEVVGSDRGNWTTFSDVDIFLACSRKPKLFDIALQPPINSQNAKSLIRTCHSVANEIQVQQEAVVLTAANNSTANVLSDEAQTFRNAHACSPEAFLETVQQPQMGRSVSSAGRKSAARRGQFLASTRAIQSELLRGSCESSHSETVLFSHYGKTVAGLYSGARWQDQRLASTAIQTFIDRIRDSKEDIPDVLTMQLCGGEYRTSEFVFGFTVDTTPGSAGLANVQHAVASWSNATCVDGFDETFSAGNVTLAVHKGGKHEQSASSAAVENRDVHQALGIRAECSTTEVVAGEGCWAVANRCGISQDELTEYNGGGNFCSTLIPSQVVCCSPGELPSTGPAPNPDGTCATVQVVSGDSCGTLASKCGITGANFEEFNSYKSNLCSTLAVGQHVCCSEGELPDMTPQPNPDGSCATYTIIEGEWCAKIAAANGITTDDIENYNVNTWGFTGCANLTPGAKICLSEGNPPMPPPISNAICGPQVPETSAPSDTSREALAELNPCPLNVCCNIWGQCGTTGPFCETPEDAPLGTEGCISNCGTEIVNNDQAPDEVRHIAYFEAYNGDRPCLYMNVEDVDRSYYTHLHFSFVDLTTSFGVSTANVKAQWDRLLELDGIKRIAAFGGWAASTQPSTYYLFRQGVRPENRETLASNLAAFIVDSGLEGIDIDWEYPGAPDIPGIPPADPMDGDHYLEFLKLLREKLPSDKSLAIAAPASYWYLRGFPIDQIAEVVDYIVFMTYDLHGQWDYGSPWTQSGCPEGNCLRSHVNMTETINALTMITKAGVPSHKINVGVSSYGRSFKAAEPGCYGPMCRYLGELSQAAPGRCTGQAGYIANAEINDLMVQAGGNSQLKRSLDADWFRDDSESDIIVYNSTEWAGFMNSENKLSRTNKWVGLNFGGISDWAADLKRFSAAEGGSTQPQPIEEGLWQAVPCTVEAVEDINMDPRLRWEGVGADAAWQDVVNAWKNREGDVWGDTNLSIFVSDFFHGDEGMDCGVVKDLNGCRDTYLCKDFENVDGTGPAAYFILNSFVRLSSFLWNSYSGTVDAASTLDALEFSKDFGHKDRQDDNFLLFSIINALTIGLTMGVAGIFNNVMKGALKESVHNNLKDASLVLVGIGAAQTKNTINHLDTPAEIDSYVQAMLNEAVTHLQDAHAGLGRGMFKGDEASLEFLTQALADGKLVERTSNLDATDFRDQWKATIYGVEIANVWDMVGITPVIIDTGADCGDGEGVGVGDYLSSATAEIARGCVDNKLYYLLDPDGRPQWTGGAGDWHQSDFSLPNGLETVAAGKWLGVTVEDLIHSAVQWTKKHGNRHEREDGPDATFSNSWDQLWDVIEGNMVRAPGVVDIPVCPEPEARNNWFSHYGDDTPRFYEYPCNKGEE